MTARLGAISEPSRPVEPLRAELEETLREVIASGWLVLGHRVAAFERAVAAYCGTTHCVTVANGTAALPLALTALGVGVGARAATVASRHVQQMTSPHVDTDNTRTAWAL